MTFRHRLLGALAGAALAVAPALALAQSIPGTWVYMYNAPAHFTGAGTTTVASKPGVVHTVCVNTGASTSTVEIEDGATPIAIIDSTTNGCYTYDSQFLTSLVVVVTGSPDVTVTYAD